MNAFWSVVIPLLLQAWSFFIALYPIWLPILLAAIFWDVWLNYIRVKNWAKLKTVLLEIRLPQEIVKSPRAMEVVINSLYNTGGEGNFALRYWQGNTRPTFSLELVSDGGRVRFLLWTRENLRNYVESQIYAQYPDVEIHQVEDYATKIVFDPKINTVWGCRFELAASNVLPIASYVDYGLDLDKNPKEEFKIDPLSQTLELLSTVKPGEHMWLQIVIRAHKNEKRGGPFSEASDWRKEIRKTRDAVFEAIKKEGRIAGTTNEIATVSALGRAYQKYPFDCGMRALYIVDDKEKFSVPMIGTLTSLLRPFSYSAASFKGAFKDDTMAGFNGFKVAGGTGFDFPWQDFKNKRVNRLRKNILDQYKRRAFFWPPYKEKTFILTSESLATIWHFPGETSAAPGLERIPSTRAQAPNNLPV